MTLHILMSYSRVAGLQIKWTQCNIQVCGHSNIQRDKVVNIYNNNQTVIFTAMPQEKFNLTFKLIIHDNVLLKESSNEHLNECLISALTLIIITQMDV